MERLEEKMERGWTPKDLRSKHIAIILEACAKRPWDSTLKSAFSVVYDCAELGNDVDLWIRAIRTCGGVQHPERPGVPAFVSGIHRFGVERLKSLYVSSHRNMRPCCD